MTSTAPTSTGMTLDEIKAAVLAGTPVYFQNTNYVVTVDHLGQWFIVCQSNDYCIGLTWRDGVTVNGKPEQFFKGKERAGSGSNMGDIVCAMVAEWDAFYADPERCFKASSVDAVRNLGDWLKNESDYCGTVDESLYPSAADAAYAMGTMGCTEDAICTVVAMVITRGQIAP